MYGPVSVYSTGRAGGVRLLVAGLGDGGAGLLTFGVVFRHGFVVGRVNTTAKTPWNGAGGDTARHCEGFQRRQQIGRGGYEAGVGPILCSQAMGFNKVGQGADLLDI